MLDGEVDDAMMMLYDDDDGDGDDDDSNDIRNKSHSFTAFLNNKRNRSPSYSGDQSAEQYDFKGQCGRLNQTVRVVLGLNRVIFYDYYYYYYFILFLF